MDYTIFHGSRHDFGRELGRDARWPRLQGILQAKGPSIVNFCPHWNLCRFQPSNQQTNYHFSWDLSYSKRCWTVLKLISLFFRSQTFFSSNLYCSLSLIVLIGSTLQIWKEQGSTAVTLHSLTCEGSHWEGVYQRWFFQAAARFLHFPRQCSSETSCRTGDNVLNSKNWICSSLWYYINTHIHTYI